MIFTILIFVITILVLVVFHELGHFLVAKKFNIKVLEFGFGLPPKLWGKKIGETLVSLNLLPFGGFVRLLGEDEDDKKYLNDERSFVAQNVWKKIAVVIAGVFMNLLLAWIIFYVVLISQDFKIIYPAIEPIVSVGQVEEGFPAKESGILMGDRVISANGQVVNDPQTLVTIIKSNQENRPIELVVSDIDGGSIRTVTLVPRADSSGEKRIGIAFSPIPIKEYKGTFEKLFSGITYSYDATKYTLLGLGKLLTDVKDQNFQKASDQVAGPVGLVVITNNIVSLGSEAILFYLWFVGIMSLTLAIFNVLPIPALDGGRLFFLLIEAITGKKTNPTFERIVHNVGMIVLMLLMLLITFSDVRKLIF